MASNSNIEGIENLDIYKTLHFQEQYFLIQVEANLRFLFSLFHNVIRNEIKEEDDEEEILIQRQIFTFFKQMQTIKMFF